jgi:activator of HSP90 ATPase
MLEAFAHLLQTFDPDILVSFEMQKQSFGYLIDRYAALLMKRKVVSAPPSWQNIRSDFMAQFTVNSHNSFSNSNHAHGYPPGGASSSKSKHSSSSTSASNSTSSTSDAYVGGLGGSTSASSSSASSTQTQLPPELNVFTAMLSRNARESVNQPPGAQFGRRPDAWSMFVAVLIPHYFRM